MTKVRLVSNDLIWTPGVMRWAKMLYDGGFADERIYAMNVVQAMFGGKLNNDEVLALLRSTKADFEAMIDDVEGTFSVAFR